MIFSSFFQDYTLTHTHTHTYTLTFTHKLGWVTFIVQNLWQTIQACNEASRRGKGEGCLEVESSAGCQIMRHQGK